jgi:gluconokinase
MPSVVPAAAEAPYVLALDLGTSSFRALVYDARVRALEGSEQQLTYPIETTADGGAQVDAGKLVDLTVECIDGVLAAIGPEVARRIAAVGTTSFWHSLLGLDSDGEPVTPVLIWADSRSGRQVDELRHELDAERVHQETGTFLHSSYWPAKLRWVRAERPEWWGRVRHWCSFTDYLFARLTGDGRTSISMASGTGLLAVHDNRWHAGMAAVAGIDVDALPKLTDRDEPLRPPREEWARRWPALADIPWFPAIGDGAAANVGSFAARPGRLALTLGTSGALRMIARTDRAKVPKGLWAYRLDRDRYVLGGALSNGGNATHWMMDRLGAGYESEELRAACAMPPDSHGLTMLPFLAGERSPTWNDHARGTVVGLRLATTKADLLRATMESVVYRFGLIADRLIPMVGEAPMVIANGGAVLRSEPWLQMTADILGEPVIALPAEDEASAAGAAIVALAGAGLLADIEDAPDWATGEYTRRFDPEPEHHRIYRAASERQRQLERRLFTDGDPWDAAGDTAGDVAGDAGDVATRP